MISLIFNRLIQRFSIELTVFFFLFPIKNFILFLLFFLIAPNDDDNDLQYHFVRNKIKVSLKKQI